MIKGRWQREVKIRMEEEETAYEAISAASTVETFYPGGKFSLKEHDIASEEGTYVITSFSTTARTPATKKIRAAPL